MVITPSPLDWHDPIALATNLSHQGKDFVLLCSTMDVGFSGRYSLLATGIDQQITGDTLTEFAAVLSDSMAPYDNAWFGYLGYELKHVMETLPHDPASHITFPALCMTRFQAVLVYDHHEQAIACHGDASLVAGVLDPAASFAAPDIRVTELHSNMDKATYLAHVRTIQAAIARGDLYQANVTRKFMGRLATPVDRVAMFRQLCTISPAPYSALLSFGDRVVISSSPERFLTMDANGRVETRPIKGSAGRSDDAVRDAAHKADLYDSIKDRAENLMIVDLMRNDLSRSCQVGSVETDSLYDITSYATVHHMSSTVHGMKRDDVSTLDAVMQCFPPGSMTGAPKIKAMEWCSRVEQLQRGVYSGAIGWFGGDGSCDLSVAIRVLLLEGDRFEFQVGGAIVYDSIAEAEWEETLVKAKGIAMLLGIGEEEMRGL